LNNYGFEIERKDINRDWEKLGFVKGNGTTSTTNNYSFIDKPQLAQKYFYRLKQVDFNGSFYYSDIVEITILPVEFKLYNNYPNPFNPSTKIGFNLPTDAFITLKIYNSVGELVAEIMNENKTAGFHQITFDANSLPSGIYFAELKANSTVQRIKMMLVK
ncbi:MAG: T9SS type A sorting domain-containing protein, partial [Ignavibacterium sp.]|nr:T9SS type A sorting domain-containing protein [Ignavibacterium sp.]